MTKIPIILYDEQNTPEASKITKICYFLGYFLQIKGYKNISIIL